MTFIAIYITNPDEATAKSISQSLLKEKLVACANIFPIQSSFWWNADIQSEKEFVSIVKTRIQNWEIVRERVLQLHPYEVPCIMKLEVEANKSYEDWIFSETKQAL